jgi:hypothetical protein
MKRHLLWTFDRGSFQWDIVCLLILAFLFLIPRNTFEDVPEFMKVSATEPVRRTVDTKNGNTIFTARLAEPRFFDTDDTRSIAVGMVEQSLGKPVRASNVRPIRDWTGRVIAYAVWKEK